jgi:ABC-type multidrug transport system ATPase subunit
LDPQLFELLSAREHLLLYARLKRVPEPQVLAAVKTKLTELGLDECADRKSAGYSGGQKRKLSLAIALIGGPQILFLDEPSTGMDPIARRKMWRLISRVCAGGGGGGAGGGMGQGAGRRGCSLVLTTHSMEECEALCTRIAIMAAGRMRCLGSSQHLKTRFGQGYQVEIGLKQIASIVHTGPGTGGNDTHAAGAKEGGEEGEEEEDAVAVVTAAVHELRRAIEAVRASDALLMNDWPVQHIGADAADATDTADVDTAAEHGLSRVQLLQVLRSVDGSTKGKEEGGEGLELRVSEEGRGAVLHHSLISRGWVRLEEVGTWLVEERRMDSLHAFMRTHFGPECVVHEVNGMRARYEVPQAISSQQPSVVPSAVQQGGDMHVELPVPSSNPLSSNPLSLNPLSSNLSVAAIFGVLEGNKHLLSIREYSLSQTTLEQIFNRIASKHMKA